MLKTFAGTLGPGVAIAYITLIALCVFGLIYLLIFSVKGMRNSKKVFSKHIYGIFLVYLIIALLLFISPIENIRGLGGGMFYALFWAPLAIVPAVLLHIIWKAVSKK